MIQELGTTLVTKLKFSDYFINRKFVHPLKMLLQQNILTISLTITRSKLKTQTLDKNLSQKL